MRIILGFVFISVLAIWCVPVRSIAQLSKKDEGIYQVTAAKLRQEMWGSDLPHFKEYAVPEKYLGYSRVLIASNISFSIGDAIASKNAMTKIAIAERRLVKLNDAAAVEAYSTLSFTELRKSTGYYEGYKGSGFMSARVIKPDGRISEVSADEIVLTKDEENERKARLAIPDLQPGDLLDYYVVREVNVNPVAIRTIPLYFDFYNEMPTLHFSVHGIVGKKFAAEYRCYNSAPDFRHSKDDDGNTILDVTADTLLLLPKDVMWTAPLRQAPMIGVNIVRGDAVPYTPFTRRKPGDLIKDQNPEVIVRDAMIDLNFLKKYVLQFGLWHMRLKSDVVDAYYNALTKGGGRLQEDSAAAELYYMFRFDYMFGKIFTPDAERIAYMAQTNLNAASYTYLLSEYIKQHGMGSEVVLSTSNRGVKMDELLDKAALHAMCNVRGSHDILLGISDLYSPAFYVPEDMEGISDAVAVDTKGPDSYMAGNYTSRKIPTPRSGPDDNQRKETLSLMLDPVNNGVRVLRSTALTGHFKAGIQAELLPIEDFYNYEREYFDDSRTLAERLAERKSPQVAEEITAAFKAARERQKDAFLAEAKAWLEQDITDQTNISIINPGVRHTSPSFEYASAFHLNGILKKAGGNYILEVGKLTGHPFRVSEAQRSRSLDIYGRFARTTKIEMTIRVPDGYSVEGLEALNKSASNNTGGYTAAAGLEGNVVSIQVAFTFAFAHYANEDWPQLLSIIDAAADWTGSKLLLKKKP